ASPPLPLVALVPALPPVVVVLPPVEEPPLVAPPPLAPAPPVATPALAVPAAVPEPATGEVPFAAGEGLQPLQMGKRNGETSNSRRSDDKRALPDPALCPDPGRGITCNPHGLPDRTKRV
ncbi:MAG TPA: hypothetical protein VNG33_05460, partial [Polyangiaceae bacterium]|nr:hypothetical protein [Polyangiaceae bacterium]